MGASKTQQRPAKSHVRTGDQVMVIGGANKGRIGTVIEVRPRDQRVILEGDAAVYHTKHVRPDPQRNEQGGRIQKPRPIHISNVQLLDPTTNKPTRVRRERTEKGVVRVAKGSGHRFEAQ